VERRFEHHALPVSVALAAPAVRLTVVEVYANPAPDGGWDAPHEFHPALAILATAAHSFARRCDPSRSFRVAPTPEGMEAHGWVFQSHASSIAFDVVVCDPEFGLCEASSAFDAVNVAFRVVACPWPAEEDAERLAPVVEELRAEAIAKARADARSEGGALPTAPAGAETPVVA
jgi:hypothetical protein